MIVKSMGRRGRRIAAAAALAVLLSACAPQGTEGTGPGTEDPSPAAAAVSSETASSPSSPEATGEADTSEHSESAASSSTATVASPSPSAPPATSAAPPSMTSSPAPVSSAPAASTPPAATTAPPVTPSAPPAPAPASSSRPAVQPMPESEPTRLIVEKAGVDTPLIRLGVQEDGTVGVPKGDPGAPAGWYEYSPTPGEVGPSVYLGHVYDTGGEGVFIDLNVLVPGDRVRVPRKDGTEAVFEVYKAEYYGKGREDFPTEQVYGNTAGPEIRLITCDGYDPATGHWNDNLVVYGRLVAG